MVPQPLAGRGSAMADWSPLRRMLAEVDGELTMDWSVLDRLVGGLPRSAYDHAAFWKGDRRGWPGFTTTGVRVGESVTFVRRDPAGRPARSIRRSHPEYAGVDGEPADVLLVGCVKSKLDRPAPARDLYTSPLFRKERAYAEANGVPWFVLSAEHGLVEPSRVIEPYELRLGSTDRGYRVAWGASVVEDLANVLGDLTSKRVEVHAGAAYVKAIRKLLTDAGATVVEPLEGLTMGERLAWYGPVVPLQGSAGPRDEVHRPDEVRDLVRALRDGSCSLSPVELNDRGPAGLDAPGLYSWWVDVEGARHLSDGLGETVTPGLIYAGLAGATRTRSGRRSTNTLWGRLSGMHLGARHEFSTFRRSLGSILAEQSRFDEIDEDHLTRWMHEHLRVIAVPVQDADALDGLETGVLEALDPPLNLAKMPKDAVRRRLSELRGRYSGSSAKRRDDSATVDRTTIRLPVGVEEHSWLRQAADEVGESVPDFILRAALDRADAIGAPGGPP